MPPETSLHEIPSQRHAARACGDLHLLATTLRSEGILHQPHLSDLADTLDQAAADLSTEIGALPNCYVEIVLGVSTEIVLQLQQSGDLVAGSPTATTVYSLTELYPEAHHCRPLTPFRLAEQRVLFPRPPGLPAPRPRQTSLAQFGLSALPSSLDAIPRLEAAAIELGRYNLDLGEELLFLVDRIQNFTGRFEELLIP